MDIYTEDAIYYIDRHLDDMGAILLDLGDDLANLAPDLPGANSAYAILTHCLGVIEYWAGQVVAGRRIQRDRPAEFRATGRVEVLLVQLPIAKQKLRADLEGIDS